MEPNAVSAVPADTSGAPPAPHPSLVPPRTPKPALRIIAVLLALGGWWLSFELLRVTGGESPVIAMLGAACGDDAGRNTCRSLTRSSAFLLESPARSKDPSKLPWAVPWAAMGMAYFSAIGLWYALVGPPSRGGGWWHALLLLMVSVGAFYSLMLIGAMGQMQRWCALCLYTHLINGLLLVVTLVAFPWRGPRPMLSHPRPALAIATLLAGAGVGVAQIAIVLTLLFQTNYGQVAKRLLKLSDDPAVNRALHAAAPLREIPLREDEAFEGEASAPHTLVVFGDFQCPRCVEAHDAVAEALRRYPARLRVAYRHYPQDKDCNPHEKIGGHEDACVAARAAEAARIAGGNRAYLRMRQELYEHQRDLPLRDFNKYAAHIGLRREDFEKAYASDAAMARVREDCDLARRIGVTTVPVLFLDGRQVEGWRSQKVWDALLAPAGSPATQPTADETIKPDE